VTLLIRQDRANESLANQVTVTTSTHCCLFTIHINAASIVLISL